jgi:DnaK suppressor protein
MDMTSNSSLDSHVLLLFRSTLEEQQRELCQAIEKAERDVRALSDAGPADPADISCGNSFKESMFENLSQIWRQLRLVEYALERIRIGEFGICASCDEVIGLKRLQAVPWAKHCLECQKRVEHVQRYTAIVLQLYGGNTYSTRTFAG